MREYCKIYFESNVFIDYFGNEIKNRMQKVIQIKDKMFYLIFENILVDKQFFFVFRKMEIGGKFSLNN